MFCDGYFFVTVPEETNYLRMCWTDVDQVFRIDTWVDMITLTLFPDSSMDIATVINFGG